MGVDVVDMTISARCSPKHKVNDEQMCVPDGDRPKVRGME